MSISVQEFRKLKPVTVEDDERLISEEKKMLAKKYREINKEKLAKYDQQYSRQYYEENKDKVKEYIRQWTNEHIEERKEYMHNWYEINKEMLNECSI